MVDKLDLWVRLMFGEIVFGYDWMNYLLLMNWDCYWCWRIVWVVVFQLGDFILDVCMGIGDFVFVFVCGDCVVEVFDFCFEMLEIGEWK